MGEEQVKTEGHSESATGAGDAIEMVLPADVRLIRLARLVAGGVGGSADFDVDGVDDLRIAVDEMCTALIESGDGGPLHLHFSVSPESVEVRGETSAAGGATEFEGDRLTLSKQILGVVVDEFDLAASGDSIRFRLVKRAPGGLADVS